MLSLNRIFIMIKANDMIYVQFHEGQEGDAMTKFGDCLTVRG